MTNHYELKARVLKRKYDDTLKDWKGVRNDKGLAYNLYSRIIEECDRLAHMEELGLLDNYICVAINEKMDREEKTIDEIIAYFQSVA